MVIGVDGTIDGGLGVDTLNVQGGGSGETVNVSAGVVTIGLAQTGFTNIDVLDLDTAGGEDDITVDTNGSPQTIVIDSGTGNDDIQIDLSNGATNTIEIDGGTDSGDELTINGTDSIDTISVDGLIVTADDVLVEMEGIEDLTVAAGLDDDVLSLTGTSVPGDLELLGQGGSDVFTLDTPITTGTLTVDGGVGDTDQLLVNTPSTSDQVSLSATQIDIVGDATIVYSEFEELELDTQGGSDDVTITDTHAGETTISTGEGDDDVLLLGSTGQLQLNTNAGEDDIDIRAAGGLTAIDAGSESDTVNVSSDAPNNAGNLSGISAPLSIDAGDGANDVLNVSNSGDSNDNMGVLTPFNIIGLGTAAGIAYQEFDGVEPRPRRRNRCTGNYGDS